MARDSSSFRRSPARFVPQPTVLILCEDSKSGKRYIEDAAHYFRVDAKVDVVHCGVTHPSGIVEEAIKRKAKFDKVYCAIDRDEHKCFDRAILMARAHDNIHLIRSFPCFEFWLLLHFGYNRKPFSRSGAHSAGDNVGRALKQQEGMKEYDKGSSSGCFNVLLGEKFELARKVSPRVILDVGKSGESNPSTEFHILMDGLEQLGKLQPL